MHKLARRWIFLVPSAALAIWLAFEMPEDTWGAVVAFFVTLFMVLQDD